MRHNTPRHAAFIAALVLVAGAPALAQQSPAKEPPLKGPAVKDGGVPGQQRKFSGGAGGDRKDRVSQQVPAVAYMRALHVLRGDKADQALRLTPEQEDQIKTAEREYRDQVDAYRTAHAEEIKALREQLPARERRRVDELLRAPGRPAEQRPKDAKPADRPARDDAPMMDEPMQEQDAAAIEAARNRLREIAEGAPKPADTQARVYSVLTPPQREVFNTELERIRKELQNRRPGQQGGKPAGKPGEPAALDDSRIPERIRERLKDATPEERERILKELQERQRQREPR